MRTMPEDKAVLLLDTLQEAIKGGWRKVMVSLSDHDVQVLERIIKRCGSTTVRTAGDVAEVARALEERRVIIIIEPKCNPYS